MKDKIILIAILSIFVSFLPLVATASEQPKSSEEPLEEGKLPIASAPNSLDTEGIEEDIIFNVFNTETGEAMELKGIDYITRVVAAEMPASFEEEALKAQTVAAFTYALDRKTDKDQSDHEGCELCTDSTHCKAYAELDELKELWGDEFSFYYSKVSDAVKEVYGEYMSYGGEPITAVFHSISSGVTESAETVWGHSYPYLVSVDSSGDRTVKNYETKVTFSKSQVKKIMRDYSDKCDFSNDPKKWFSNIERSDVGSVLTLNICGVVTTGSKVRELYGLRSTSFTVEYSSVREEFTFTVHGHGHGVGMSQYGANLMAKEGASYKEILLHYYTGVKLEPKEKGIYKFQ